MELFVILLGVLLAAILHKPEKPKDEKPKKPEVKMFPLREEVYTNEHGQTIKRTEYITPTINNYPAAWTEPNNQRE
jgi:hypothetical protein